MTLTQEQYDALIACAQALKEILGAAEGGEPYTEIELCAVDNFRELGVLYKSGILLPGEE